MPTRVKMGPRFGFAYSANSKMSIRGGYGIFWAPLPFSFQSTLGYSQSTPIITSIDNNFTPAASLDNPYPSGLLQPAGNSAGGSAGIGQSISVYDRKTRSGGYVEQFSLDVQRQLKGNVVLSAGFIGSRGIHLVQDGRNIDQLDPQYLSLGSALNANVTNPMYNRGGLLNVGNPTISQSQLLLPFPQFTGVTVNGSDTNHSRYDALYAKVQRRFSQGMTLLATYTWSRNLDLGYGTTSNSYSTAPAGPQNAYNLPAEYGLSTSHTPHRLSMAASYLLPFKPHNRLLATAAGGWSINVTGVMQSGYPLAISQPNNNSVIGASTQRPNATGVGAAVDAPFEKRIDGWINPGGILAGIAIHLRQRRARHLAPRTGPDQLRYLGVQGVHTHGEAEGAVPRRSAQYLQYADLLWPEHHLHQSAVRHHHQPGQLPAADSNGGALLPLGSLSATAPATFAGAGHSLRTLHPDPRALRTLPLSLLVVDVPLQFFHRNPALPARHAVYFFLFLTGSGPTLSMVTVNNFTG